MSPIAITVYNRLDNFKNCINSLLNCPEAIHCDLFISSDYPKNNIDLPKVKEIRNYIQSIKGFRNINYIFFETNVGLERAYNELFNKVFDNGNDTIIFLEDDIIVKPDFLRFMNQGLAYYEEDDRIIGISGFSHSLFFKNEIKNKNHIYFTNRWCPWGFATWKDRFKTIPEYDVNALSILLSDKNFTSRLDAIGFDLLPVFKRKLFLKQKLNMDYLNTFYMVDKNLFMVTPYFTKTLNTGNDGNGTRTRKNNKYSIANSVEKIESLEFVFLPFENFRINNSFNFRLNNNFTNKFKRLMDQFNLLQFAYNLAEWKKKRK